MVNPGRLKGGFAGGAAEREEKQRKAQWGMVVAGAMTEEGQRKVEWVCWQQFYLTVIVLLFGQLGVGLLLPGELSSRMVLSWPCYLLSSTHFTPNIEHHISGAQYSPFPHYWLMEKCGMLDRQDALLNVN